MRDSAWIKGSHGKESEEEPELEEELEIEEDEEGSELPQASDDIDVIEEEGER